MNCLNAYARFRGVEPFFCKFFLNRKERGKVLAHLSEYRKRKEFANSPSVGLSKHPTRDENSQQPPRTADSSTTLNRPETQDSTASMYGRLADSEMGLPFTEAELALALTRTTIKS